MTHHSQTAVVHDTTLTSNNEEDKENISQEYEKLNEKCDTVITKIKKRKEKQFKKIN